MCVNRPRSPASPPGTLVRPPPRLAKIRLGTQARLEFIKDDNFFCTWDLARAWVVVGPS